MSWIQHPVTLIGSTAQLMPMDENHFEALCLAGADEKIWRHYLYNGADRQEMLKALSSFVQARPNGERYPFVVMHTLTNNVVGVTQYLDIQPAHKKLEIGSTWYNPAYWGTGLNTECKLLLLTYAFETLGAIRVQLKTNENNSRSRAAIQKIGAKFEGVLRNNMIMPNGLPRNDAFYSITGDEWPKVKEMLENMLQA